MIEARQLVKRYGEIEAVADVSLTVHPGELFGLIGHNGAGKSTLFKMLLGLEAPTAGEVRIGGQPMSSGAFRSVRRNLGYLPENVVFYDNLTGQETLEFFAALKRAPRTDCARVLERVGLSHAADRRVRGYSKGMRQRLGFAQALLGQPTLLFLDEPTNGLDPQGIRDFYRTLGELQAQGVTIVLTSHILSEIQERVGRLAIMKNGRVHAQGTVQSLRESMALPLWFDLRLTGGPEHAEPALRRALAAAPGCELHIDGPRATVLCPRPAKMPLLQSLSTLGATLADLQLREPSLEDVLLGQPA
ncbi:ABC transporter ATP-binding protein (plasmid) [Ralstonia wenshanensis]|uniref:ABC transporter ATP-binding protein n=1 Tax=Ralstonia TaxID=48736 RepID=UPI001E59DF4F|nr:ABC transporter ATP-binding protein [Ralstonia wenshanensis]UGS89183.1 ABC transporter ATP-binding protein [Ralstonia wenshanensis]